MSANEDENGEQIPGREVAYRPFAAEYDDASMSYAESDEERAPNYVISPTGARLNRVFVVGTLTEVTSVNDEMVRARVVDPTGAFVVYAGQYQPDELATLEQLQPPAFVAVTGKARTFQPDDSDQVYTSIRPESIATVDADTRDRWVVSAAEQTRERVGTYAAAAELDVSGDALTDALVDAGVDKGLAAGIPLAQDHYGTTPTYLEALRDCALEAVEVVAGERDQVSPLSIQPGDSSPDADASFASLADLAGVDLADVAIGIDTDAEAESQPAEAVAATAGPSGESIDAGSAAGTATGTEPDAASAADSEAADDAALEAQTETRSDAEPEAADESAIAADSSAEPDASLETDSSPAADSESDPATASFDESAGVDDSADTDDAGAESIDLDDSDADASDDLGDFDADEGGMYEMDDEEREQLESEFGAEFTTGSEVEEPGEAGIDVPEPDEEPESAALETESEPAESDADAESGAVDDELGEPPASGLDDEAEPESETEPDVAESAADDAADTDTDDEGDDDEPAEDVDLQTYVVETMQELDDGDGADRSTLVETVADDTGAAEDDVEDAIQDALMGGQCYEPDDETLKAI